MILLYLLLSINNSKHSSEFELALDDFDFLNFILRIGNVHKCVTILMYKFKLLILE